MATSTVDHFVAEHIEEHRLRFNQACHLIGYTGMTAGSAMAALQSGHRFVGLEVLMAGFGLFVVGHVVERNLARALQDFLRHPFWTVRGDLTVLASFFRR